MVLLTVLCQCIAAVYIELLIVLRQCVAAIYMDLLKILSQCMAAVYMEMLTVSVIFHLVGIWCSYRHSSDRIPLGF